MSSQDPKTHARGDMPTATLRVRAAEVVVTQGPDAGRTARVDRPTFVIGSGTSADLRLTDDTVSREHLRLSLLADGIRVKDVGSTNGSWMGTLRVSDVVLGQSTSFVIGGTTLAIHLEAAPVDLPMSESGRFGAALGESNAMRHLFAMLERAAKSDVSVLIEGESGVGKDLLAHGLHQASTRASGPYVAIDCGAIPPSLIESELFGHERGAFTGADRARDGAFVQADGGTLFLDEIGELPLDMQPKLLRALETREVRPLGGNKVRRVDLRVVAATNRNLGEASLRNEFRRDLFYRLAVARVGVPPLRERTDDIVPLARSFLHRVAGFEGAELPPELVAMLLSYPWPGTVRELKNVISRYTVFGGNPTALFDSSAPRVPAGEDLSQLPYHEARALVLERFERAYLPGVLARAGNVVVRAAELAQVGRGSFHRMLLRIRSMEKSEDE
jgi:transcriptional regulator with PAS, ATPase and Fis domain